MPPEEPQSKEPVDVPVRKDTGVDAQPPLTNCEVWDPMLGPSVRNLRAGVNAAFSAVGLERPDC